MCYSYNLLVRALVKNGQRRDEFMFFRGVLPASAGADTGVAAKDELQFSSESLSSLSTTAVFVSFTTYVQRRAAVDAQPDENAK